MKYVDEQNTEMSSQDLPTAVRNALKVCERIPDNEAWSVKRLAEVMGYRVTSLSHHTPHPALRPYRLPHQSGRKVFFANKKTAEAEQKRAK